MLTKERINKFYADLQALGLKHPVASITRATGFPKSNVSEYLSRKKEPSENFIDKFYKEFYDDSTDGHSGNGQGGRNNKKSQKVILDLDVLLDLLKTSQQEKKRLLDVIDFNLTSLVSTQQVILGHVKAGHKWEAKKHGKGSAQKEDAILAQLNKFADEYIPGGEVVDKNAQRGK